MNPLKRDVWDSVLSKDAMTCGRKFYYLHVEGWRPRKQSVDLIFGQLYATALEHYHKFRALGADQEEALENVVTETLVATWLRKDKDDPGRPWDTEGHKKNRETLLRTIIWYIDQFGDNDSMEVVHFSDGRPAVELSFTVELSGNVAYAGHMDRLVRYQGETYVQDQKTTGSTLAPNYFEQWNYPEPQMTGYSFAGKIIFNQPVKGIIIDAAQIAVGFSRFERGYTFRTDAQFSEWKDTILYHIDLMHRQDFRMNPMSCDKYGGCVFRSVCSRDPSIRENFLRADFEQAPLWNPEERR